MGPGLLCSECQKMMQPVNREYRLHHKKIWILYTFTRQIERILLKIIQFGDVEGAAAFLDEMPQERKRLRRFPIRLLDLDMESETFRSFVHHAALKDERQISEQAGKAVKYLAISIHPVSRQQVCEVLGDPYCRGLWILCEKEEHQSREWFSSCLEDEE